jgi:hypothetical protein
MFKKFACLILICVAGRFCIMAQIGEQEYDLKAAFVYNFTKYIDWGNTVSKPFTIGVIGASPIYTPLREIAKAKTVGDKKIVVIHFNNPDDITPCNILFISANSYFSLSSVLARIDKGTLTISEQPGFAEMGTAFNFVVDHDKLKFEANVNSISEEGLKASSQLLKLAIIVN